MKNQSTLVIKNPLECRMHAANKGVSKWLIIQSVCPLKFFNFTPRQRHAKQTELFIKHVDEKKVYFGSLRAFFKK